MILDRIGQFIVRRARMVLIVSFIGAIGAVGVILDLSDHLKFEGFVDPDSEAYAGQKFLEEHFGVGVPNLAFVVTSKSGTVDDPTVDAEAAAFVARVQAEPEVSDIVSYWTAGRPPGLRSENGSRALVVGRIEGDDAAVEKRLRALTPRFTGPGDTVDIRVGGSAEALRDIVDVSKDDLAKAEVVTLPLILVALIIVFGSVVAAMLPLVIAVEAVLGTAVALRLISEHTTVSTFSLWLTTVLGLGLAIDYSLFMVSRFREELAEGHEPGAATLTTVRTAGRTVLFSSAAVVIAFSALAILPLSFLRSFGYAGMATGVMAGAGALLVLPAVLVTLGHRVNAWTVWKRSTRPADGSGLWARVAVLVMKRPVLVAAAALVVLVLAGTPILNIRLGLVDDRQLSKGNNSRDVGDILRSEFAVREASPISVVLPGTDVATRGSDVAAYATRLASIPEVMRVDTALGSYSSGGRVELPVEQAQRYARNGSTFLNLVTDVEPIAPASEPIIEAVRATPAPSQALVTGYAVNAYDVKKAIVGTFPRALVFMLIATFAALFLQFGSLLVPLKAVVVNVLSLSALFGAMVWVFQDGHLNGLLDVTSTGWLYVNLPIIIFCVAFGLSMDYEVFLLSRIKEEYDRGATNEEAIALGLERSGRIVSSAALLIGVVFLTSGILGSIQFSKAFGLGLSLVVLGDAFLIRGTLVPALMKLAGPANWWLPSPLRRIHDRIGISESPEGTALPVESRT